MILDYEPGDKVTSPENKDWGIGQVQSIIKDKVTAVSYTHLTLPTIE